MLKNISHQKKYTFWYSFQWSDEIASNDSQVVGQTEIMQEILPQVPKLSGLLMNKTHEDQTVFFQKKNTLEKCYAEKHSSWDKITKEKWVAIAS